MRAVALLLVMALCGCAWQAQESGSGSTDGTGSTGDEVIVVTCAVEPPGAVAPGVTAAWHDFGSRAAQPTFKERVVAFQAGGTGTAPVSWPNQGTTGYVACGEAGQVVDFLVLP